MCRLLGYASPLTTTVSAVLGRDQSAVFQDMARLHRDGWGTAWLTADDEIEVERSDDSAIAASALLPRLTKLPTSGFDDDDLAKTLAGDLATARLIHLRMASEGMVCVAENTHPFTADDLSFAHNGAVTPVSRFDDLLSDEMRDGLIGTTDSERYFAAIRTRMSRGESLVDATRATVATLRQRFPSASMNALILSPTHLIAVHASADARIPHEDFDNSGIAEHELPRDHRAEYYLMRVKQLDDGTVIFASSGLDIAGWAPLPAESIAVVELDTLTMTVLPIGADASAASASSSVAAASVAASSVAASSVASSSVPHRDAA